MKNIIITLVISFLPILTFSQNQVEGVVYEGETNKPLLGANVYWLDTEVGVVTDFDGKFSIPYKKSYKKLIVSYVGFTSDTLDVVNPTKKLKATLSPKSSLDEVKLVARKKATSRSYIEAQNVINVSSDELLKAACCNLAESFETNPSIDVNFADAIFLEPDR
tara:strand:+ start:1411 stop:1899 length:489 start_codon:yes stop_codon:yes gene_type:complete